MESGSLRYDLKYKIARYHEGVPGLRRLPLPAVAIIVGLILVNVVVWAVIGVVLHYNGALVSTAVLSYTLGLRHALDADHISIGDRSYDATFDSLRAATSHGGNILFSGPFYVCTQLSGFYLFGETENASVTLILAEQYQYRLTFLLKLLFSIVVITSIVVAATASAISTKFGAFSHVGGIIGTSVSAVFLILLGVMNAYILLKLHQQLQKLITSTPDEREQQQVEFTGAGCLFHLFKKMFKIINRPWKMYPLGVMFGLGFDTSSEVALLGIASIQGAKGTSIWLILIFPLLFTVGMCLLDTVDGALMMALYTSTNLAKDQIAVLYYSIVLTVITVLVAIAIGFVQMLTLVLNVAQPNGKFWDGVEVVGEHFDIIGGAICGSFLVLGGLSILLYKPWRRRIDRKRNIRRQPQQIIDGDEIETTIRMDVSPHQQEGKEKKGEEAEGVANLQGNSQKDDDRANPIGNKDTKALVSCNTDQTA